MIGAATMPRYKAGAGVRLESVGDMWAAYSPLSGETQLLNDESAVVLEWLLERGSGNAAQAASELAEIAGMEAAELETRIRMAWPPLAAAGLIQRIAEPPTGSPP